MATPTAPTGVQLCVQGDVEMAVGGVAVLAQLLDKDGDGNADANLVTACIGTASADALAAIAVQYLPSSLTVPYPDVLVYATARLAGYYAWTFGSSEVVAPEEAQKLKDSAFDTFTKIANRTLSLGVTTPPATNQDVAQIEVNPNNDQTTRASTVGVLW